MRVGLFGNCRAYCIRLLADMIKIWKPSDLSKAMPRCLFIREPYHLGLSKDGRTLASGSEDKTVRYSAFCCIRHRNDPMDSAVRLVLFSADGKYSGVL